MEASEHENFINELTARSDTADEFITDVEFSYNVTNEDGIANFNVARGILNINALHPFVGAFVDDFLSKTLSLDLLAMAEVLLEAQLYHFGFKTDEVDDILTERDELLRALARSTGRRNALMVAQDLQNARNDPNQLEIELVAAFNKLGFDAVRISGKNKPDGRAVAHLSAHEDGRPRRYAVSLEAKSKQKSGTKVSAKDVGVSSVARHRNDFSCDHALVVGPDFPTTDKEKSVLITDMKNDREIYKKRPKQEQKTITLVRVDDLARLVRLAPLKQVGPSRLRQMLIDCSTPEEAMEWVNQIATEKPTKEPYNEILDAIWAEQKAETRMPVVFDVLRVNLRNRKPSINKTNEELIDLCRALSALVPAYVTCRERSVELEVPPQKILEAYQVATKEYPVDEQFDV